MVCNLRWVEPRGLWWLGWIQARAELIQAVSAGPGGGWVWGEGDLGQNNVTIQFGFSCDWTHHRKGSCLVWYKVQAPVAEKWEGIWVQGPERLWRSWGRSMEEIGRATEEWSGGRLEGTQWDWNVGTRSGVLGYFLLLQLPPLLLLWGTQWGLHGWRAQWVLVPSSNALVAAGSATPVKHVLSST